MRHEDVAVELPTREAAAALRAGLCRRLLLHGWKIL